MQPVKNLLISLLTLSSFLSVAQSDVAPTNGFTVKGKIKKELTVTMADLQSAISKPIPDVTITNHLGEVKYTAKNLKGILLKDFLNKVEFESESPKLLNEFFLTFIANDDYKVVYSWNEFFNSPTGDHVYVVTAKDGKELPDMNDRILIVCTTDFKTGRRFVKGLKEIIVQRVL